MRFATTTLVCALAMVQPIAAVAANLDAYVGKYPFDKVHQRSIYQVAGIKAQFVKAFGARRWATVQSYATAIPNEAVTDPALGRVIVTGQCKPHDCPNNAKVLLGIDGKLIGACFVTFGVNSGNVEWLGPGWHHKAPTKTFGACGKDAADTVARFKAAESR